MNKLQVAKYLDTVVADDEPIFVLSADHFLYPQYGLTRMVQEWLDDPKTKDWMFQQACQYLATDKGVIEVRKHWARIIQNWLLEQEAKDGS